MDGLMEECLKSYDAAVEHMLKRSLRSAEEATHADFETAEREIDRAAELLHERSEKLEQILKANPDLEMSEIAALTRRVLFAPDREGDVHERAVRQALKTVQGNQRVREAGDVLLADEEADAYTLRILSAVPVFKRAFALAWTVIPPQFQEERRAIWAAQELLCEPGERKEGHSDGV